MDKIKNEKIYIINDIFKNTFTFFKSQYEIKLSDFGESRFNKNTLANT